MTSAVLEGVISSEEYNKRPIRKPQGTIWFLNKELVRVYHKSRGSGIVTLYNINQDKLQTIMWEDWIKHRRRAYSVLKTAELLNRHRQHLNFMAWKGIVPKATSARKGGEPKFGYRSYYSEDDIREMREIMAGIQWGHPRHDGLITNNKTPTAQELSRRMGDGILVYTRTEDGRIIPIWDETI